jgi:hypothetical protein
LDHALDLPCGTAIQHHDAGPTPQVIYRRAVCHLELIIDPKALKVTVVRLPERS